MPKILVACASLAAVVAMVESSKWPVLHGDNGATIKSTTVIAMFHWLGIKPETLELVASAERR